MLACQISALGARLHRAKRNSVAKPLNTADFSHAGTAPMPVARQLAAAGQGQRSSQGICAMSRPSGCGPAYPQTVLRRRSRSFDKLFQWILLVSAG
jgi:hypothetical protein